MREIIQRLKSKSPKLFRQYNRFGAGLFGLCTSLIGLETSHSIELPLWLAESCKYGLCIGTVIMFISSQTVEGGYKKTTNKEGAS